MYVFLNYCHHIKKLSCVRFSLSNDSIFLFISLISFSTPTSKSCKFDGVFILSDSLHMFFVEFIIFANSTGKLHFKSKYAGGINK